MKIFLGLLAAMAAIVAIATNDPPKINHISPHSGAHPDSPTWEPDLDKIEILCDLYGVDFSSLNLE
jgi:hypothetical protein